MPLTKRLRHGWSGAFRTLFSTLTVFIWLAAVIVATIASPFGTFAIMEWPMRAAYWLVVISVSIVVGYGIRAVSVALVGDARPILLDVVMIAFMTLVIAPAVWLFTRVTRFAPEMDIPSLMLFAGYVMLCTAVIVIGRRIVPGFETQRYELLPTPEPNPATPDAHARQPLLLRRLATDVRGEILRLTANDHFVEVVTVKGAQSLRMRLVDAIVEMEPVEGFCVHRSHWVARAAISGVERESTQKLFVILANNDRIPVSRRYRANLGQAGFL